MNQINFEVKMVNSTAIRLIAYAKKEQILRIIFVRGGGYDYNQISPEIYKDLSEAESVGSSYWTLLKRVGKRHSRKLDTEETNQFLLKCLTIASAIKLEVAA